ncbi:DNA polymerase III subunit delta' [soil metagenome]
MGAVSPVAELPQSLLDATDEQPGVRVALAGALESPSHAYLLAGPAGSGKRAAARAFAAELLAAGDPDPESTRRRSLADPPLHPDLTWLRPLGTQHLVEHVRQQVIEAVPYRPFESDRRVFVIEAAEAMAEESQNALLKTLEEPPPFAHLILISSQSGALLETVRSRCQGIAFSALSTDALEAKLAERFREAPPEELRAVARLAAGDAQRAELLLSEPGRALRAAAEEMVRGAIENDLAAAPWKAMLEACTAAGELEGEATRLPLATMAGEVGEADPKAGKRMLRDAEEAAKRATRRGRLSALDTGLGLIAGRLRDIAAVADGAAEFVLTADRTTELAGDAERVDPRRARRGGELVMDTRRRLTVNVSEELALEALCFRLEFVLGAG